MFSLYYFATKFLSSFEIMRSCLVISQWREQSDAVKLQQQFLQTALTQLSQLYK